MYPEVRQDKWTQWEAVATVQRVLSRWHKYARTHAQDAAQHTCRHVKSVRFICTLSGEGIIALLQAEGLVHLPSVFYSGCQNGEEETEPDTLW